MAVEDGEILAVLDAVICYLSITLPGQQLSPDAQMGREDLVAKVEGLIGKINASKAAGDAGDGKSNEAEQCLVYDDVLQKDTAGDDEGARKRISSYIDMTLFQESQQSNVKEGQFTDQQDGATPDENYEVPGESNQSEVTELLEEDELELEKTGSEKSETNSDEVSNRGSEENNFEFTDEELLDKLKGFENTNAKRIAEDCICAGWLMKQKKKFYGGSFYKRFCILKEEFLFYYESSEDKKATGIIVLPGYIIKSVGKSSGKERYSFKLIPTAKNRSTYQFQALSKDEYDKWQTFLQPICSQKLNRLKSDVFNRVARRMDGESEDGSGGEPVKSPEPTGDDMYEFVPECGMAADHLQDQNSLRGSSSSNGVQEEMYDDHIGSAAASVDQSNVPGDDFYEGIPGESYVPEQPTTQSVPTVAPGEDVYEGIPGESYEPEPSSPEVPPIEEDIYETIDVVAVRKDLVTAPASIPPRPSKEPLPTSPSPVLPPRTHVLPPRGAPGQRPGNEEAPLPPVPPSIPSREPAPAGNPEIIEEEPQEEEAEVPSENDFSYGNVYIGTDSRAASESDELAFSRGDLIYILQKINPRWWIGCMGDKVGLVPSNLLMAGFAQ